TKVTCTCGETFEVQSINDTIQTEVCSKCHQFYTNKKPTAGINDTSNTATPHASQQSDLYGGKVTTNNSNPQ
ncbi:MAG: 50S ribosomal protein L31, partial [Muribaculaceae bacterium]|nr:50S ribosomal protein L31 [Muribaculaceae bacterium]